MSPRLSYFTSAAAFVLHVHLFQPLPCVLQASLFVGWWFSLSPSTLSFCGSSLLWQENHSPHTLADPFFLNVSFPFICLKRKFGRLFDPEFSYAIMSHKIQLTLSWHDMVSLCPFALWCCSSLFGGGTSFFQVLFSKSLLDRLQRHFLFQNVKTGAWMGGSLWWFQHSQCILHYPRTSCWNMKWRQYLPTEIFQDKLVNVH